MIREHVLDVYEVRLVLASTPKDVKKLRRRYGDQIDHAAFDGMGSTSTLEGSNDIVIYVDGSQPRLKMVNTVAHEAYHAAGFILDSVGQPFDPGTEAMAWLVGWLAEWICTHLEC